MSASGSGVPYVIVLSHEMSFDYETYLCPNLKVARSVLSEAFRIGANVVSIKSGPKAVAQLPLDITVLTDTDII